MAEGAAIRSHHPGRGKSAATAGGGRDTWSPDRRSRRCQRWVHPFAILPETNAYRIGLVGQNADLPAFYREIAVVSEMRSDNLPATLTLLPAGQISFISINDRGLGCFANFLTCDGWRIGFPRYFYSRFALTKETIFNGVAAIRSVNRH